MDKLERVACLYLAFLNNKGLTFQNIKNHLVGAYDGEQESVRRKFERDKESLQELGMSLVTVKPGDYLEDGSISGEYIYFLKDEPMRLPEVSLSRREAQYLSGLILGILGSEGFSVLSDDEKKSLSSAATKIFYKDPAHYLSSNEQQLPKTLANLLAHTNQSFVHEGLEFVHESLQKKKKLKFQYTNKAGKKSTKNVNPQGLISRQSRWCVVAYCNDNKEIRYFYLDQMDSLEILTHTFKPVAGFKMDDYNLHPLSVQNHEPKYIRLQYSQDAEDHIHGFLEGLPARFEFKDVDENTISFFTTNKPALFSYHLLHPTHIISIGPQSILEDYKEYLLKIKNLNGCILK